MPDPCANSTGQGIHIPRKATRAAPTGAQLRPHAGPAPHPHAPSSPTLPQTPRPPGGPVLTIQPRSAPGGMEMRRQTNQQSRQGCSRALLQAKALENLRPAGRAGPAAGAGEGRRSEGKAASWQRESFRLARFRKIFTRRCDGSGASGIAALTILAG